ncbi:hypothetical protein DPMN_092218 [Dreissena polymorpha]|uniref:Uncharacterized protein n=1 Tax=Dreissena polymorpha TaxID=45954 RepID=A0A9D4L1Z1_DREPO|nr:hypothetical protein DPMN_092218 [Dreissena polymorpha]
MIPNQKRRRKSVHNTGKDGGDSAQSETGKSPFCTDYTMRRGNDYSNAGIIPEDLEGENEAQ